MDEYFRKKAEAFVALIETQIPDMVTRCLMVDMKIVARDQRHACAEVACSECHGSVFNVGPYEAGSPWQPISDIGQMPDEAIVVVRDDNGMHIDRLANAENVKRWVPGSFTRFMVIPE